MFGRYGVTRPWTWRILSMKQDGRYLRLVIATISSLALVGCANPQARQGGGPAPVSPPRIEITSGPQKVVEEYLEAARNGDGAGMYALIASSERKDESPRSLQNTANDRYSPSASWKILKTEENGSSAAVVVEFQDAKVDPDPYRFTLTREAGEWRLVQSPELHEDDDDIKIKF
jgi:hypothetical protein